MTTMLSLAIALATLLTAQVAVKPAALDMKSSWGEPDEVSGIADAGIARIVTAGYNEFWASMTWVRLQVYASHSKTNDARGFSQMERILDSVIALDPYFRFAYEYAGYALTHRSADAAPTQEEYKSTIEYLERGLTYFPSDRIFRVNLATRYGTFLEPEDRQEREQNLRKAIFHLERAMETPGADLEYLSNRADVYRRRLGGDDIGSTQERLESCVARAMTESNPSARRKIKDRCEVIVITGCMDKLMESGETREFALKQCKENSTQQKVLVDLSNDETFARWQREMSFETTPDMTILLNRKQKEWREHSPLASEELTASH